MLSVEGIHSYYGKAHILSDLTFEVRRGEVVAVPMTDPFLARVPSHLLVRKGRPKTAAVRAVTGMIRDRMEAFGSAWYPEEHV